MRDGCILAVAPCRDFKTHIAWLLISHRLVPQPPRSSSCGVDCTSLLRARTRSHQLQAHLPSGKASEAEACRRRRASHPSTRCSFTDQDHSTGRRQHAGHPSQIAGMYVRDQNTGGRWWCRAVPTPGRNSPLEVNHGAFSRGICTLVACLLGAPLYRCPRIDSSELGI
jgi:hypothetical protein